MHRCHLLNETVEKPDDLHDLPDVKEGCQEDSQEFASIVRVSALLV